LSQNRCIFPTRLASLKENKNIFEPDPKTPGALFRIAQTLCYYAAFVLSYCKLSNWYEI
jgi:hypothetical protein